MRGKLDVKRTDHATSRFSQRAIWNKPYYLLQQYTPPRIQHERFLALSKSLLITASINALLAFLHSWLSWC
jgi:hypothetical protein